MDVTDKQNLTAIAVGVVAGAMWQYGLASIVVSAIVMMIVQIHQRVDADQ